MKLTDEQIRKLIPYIIEATSLKPFQVEHTVELLQEGATVPFIARYRKEHTGELDEVQIRTVEEAVHLLLRIGGAQNHCAQYHRGARKAYPRATG